MASNTARFAVLTEQDLDEILDNKDAKQTKKVVDNAVSILEAYAECKGVTVSELEQPEEG